MSFLGIDGIYLHYLLLSLKRLSMVAFNSLVARLSCTHVLVLHCIKATSALCHTICIVMFIIVFFYALLVLF